MSYPPVRVRRPMWCRWANLQVAAGLHSFLESRESFFMLCPTFRGHPHASATGPIPSTSKPAMWLLTHPCVILSASDPSQERSAVFNNSYFYMRPKRIIQDNLLHLKDLNLISSAKSLLLCIHRTQDMVIGQGHFGRP